MNSAAAAALEFLGEGTAGQRIGLCAQDLGRGRVQVEDAPRGDIDQGQPHRAQPP